LGAPSIYRSPARGARGKVCSSRVVLRTLQDLPRLSRLSLHRTRTRFGKIPILPRVARQNLLAAILDAPDPEFAAVSPAVPQRALVTGREVAAS
jgi:hypothetical protein